MGCESREGGGVTLPLKTARKAVAAAQRKLNEARLELAATLNQMEKATAQERRAALVAALRRRPKSPGRPKRYSDDDLAAVDEYLPIIGARADYLHWLACRDEEDSETGRIGYLLSRIKWRKAGDKPPPEALQKALARWRKRQTK
jgi:hypothetical protein